MTKRVVDISRSPARLSIENGRLVIKSGEQQELVALSNLGALIVSCPGVTYTHAVLDALMQAGASFICCDTKHQASGILLPLANNSIQSERFRLQAELGAAKRKRLWQEVIKAKIKAQSDNLERLNRPNPLKNLWQKVKSGDAENLEAQAARRYWSLLFGEKFRREQDGCGRNAALNYAYAIIRSMTGRALTGTGLHPSLGLHHHNRYDAYCLASDMMEPFRPLADFIIAQLDIEEEQELEGQHKQTIISGLYGRFKVEGESRMLEDIIIRACESLTAVINGSRTKLLLPVVEPNDDKTTL